MIEDYFKRDDVDFREIRGDALSVGGDFVLAHCISRDCRLGKGIAKDIDDAYCVRRVLFASGFHRGVEKVFLVEASERFAGGRGKKLIANMVNKEKYWEKPKYDSMREALVALRGSMEKYHLQKVAMPRIACGLDGLDWQEVKKVIMDVFKGSKMEIRVYYL